MNMQLKALWSLYRRQLSTTVFYIPILVFTMFLPIMLFFMFGAFQEYSDNPAGDGNYAAKAMIGMCVYGAGMASATIGAQVGVERAQGWTRQLALTPVEPVTNFVNKLLLSITSALFSILAVLAVGCATTAEGPTRMWALSPILALLGSLSTAAMGIMVGYLLRSDGAYGVILGGFAILAFFGDNFIPLDSMPSFFRDIAPFTPLYGITMIARWPLLQGTFEWTWAAGVAAWTVIFGIVSVRRMRKDTARR